MVPLAEYATVAEDATLSEAVLALERAQAEFDQTRYRHRAILIYDKNNKIVGKLSQLDILKALEPKYHNIANDQHTHRFGFTKEYLKSLHEEYSLWDKPLNKLCQKAADKKVKDIMYSPTEGEFVSEDATMDEAIHQLVVGHHHSLLVTMGDDIVGVLRLTDVFREVCEGIKACDIKI
jgi:CBS domain-containing protein